MWIWSREGFYSVVTDKDDPTRLMVRSRMKGDIESAWPSARVRQTPESDYLFRASLDKSTVQVGVEQMVRGIRYENFKAALPDRNRAIWCGRVWEVMADMQDAMGKHQV